MKTIHTQQELDVIPQNGFGGKETGNATLLNAVIGLGLNREVKRVEPLFIKKSELKYTKMKTAKIKFGNDRIIDEQRADRHMVIIMLIIALTLLIVFSSIFIVWNKRYQEQTKVLTTKRGF